MQSEAENAGGLTPTKNGSEAMRKSYPKTNAIFWLGGMLVVCVAVHKQIHPSVFLVLMKGANVI